MTAKKSAKQPKQPRSKRDLSPRDLSSVAGGAPHLVAIVAMPHLPRSVEIMAMPSNSRPIGAVTLKRIPVMAIVAMKRQ